MAVQTLHRFSGGYYELLQALDSPIMQSFDELLPYIAFEEQINPTLSSHLINVTNGKYSTFTSVIEELFFKRCGIPCVEEWTDAGFGKLAHAMGETFEDVDGEGPRIRLFLCAATGSIALDPNLTPTVRASAGL